MADWFAQNAPSDSARDWFAQNAPDKVIAVAAHARARPTQNMAQAALSQAPMTMTALPGMPTTTLPGLLASVPGLLGGAGMMLGGALGGPPGAMTLGSLAQGGGEALHQAGNQALGLPFDYSRVPGQGLMGAGTGLLSELGALGLQKAIPPVQSYLAAKAMRPTAALLQKFPNLIPAAMRMRLLPEGWAETGGMAAQKAAQLREASSALEQQIAQAMPKTSPEELAAVAIRNARAKGKAVTPEQEQEIVDQVRAKAAELLSNRTHGILPEDVPTPPAPQPSGLLDAQGVPYPAPPAPPRPPREFTGDEVRQIKQYADRVMSPEFGREAKGAGTVVNPIEKSLGRAARLRLRLNPAMEQQMKNTQTLMGLQQGLSAAEATPMRSWEALRFGPFNLGVSLPYQALSRMALAQPDALYQGARLLPPLLGAVHPALQP